VFAKVVGAEEPEPPRPTQATSAESLSTAAPDDAQAENETNQLPVEPFGVPLPQTRESHAEGFSVEQVNPEPTSPISSLSQVVTLLLLFSSAARRRDRQIVESL
jgi:hypothetical protein